MGKRGPKPNPKARKENPTAVRLPAGLRARLEAEYKESGAGTLSQEIINRLERSFTAESKSIRELGGPWTYSFLKLVAVALTDVTKDSGHPWHLAPYSFHHAVEAVLEIMGYYQPKGKPAVPVDHPILEMLRSRGIKDLKPFKAHLEKYELGRKAAMMAVYHMEVSSESSDEFFDVFRDINHRIRPRLLTNGMTGKAKDALFWADDLPEFQPVPPDRVPSEKRQRYAKEQVKARLQNRRTPRT